MQKKKKKCAYWLLEVCLYHNNQVFRKRLITRQLRIFEFFFFCEIELLMGL
jgi:hypothetical protein